MPVTVVSPADTQQSTLANILTAIRTQLQTKTGFPAARVRIVAKWPPVAGQQVVGDQDVLIRPLGFVADPDALGAGRLETTLHRTLGVMCRTRLSVDNPPGDESWLTDGTYGHINLEETVIDALQNFIPQNLSTNNWYVIAPLQLQSGTEPDRPNDDDGYGEQVLTFDVVYRPPVDWTVNVSN